MRPATSTLRRALPAAAGTVAGSAAPGAGSFIGAGAVFLVEVGT